MQDFLDRLQTAGDVLQAINGASLTYPLKKLN